MKLYTCTVEIGGSRNHVVTHRVVSVPEILVLKHIHGPEHVTGFAPFAPAEGTMEAEWTLDGERARLSLKYPVGEDDKPLVSTLFGPIARLPDSLAEIGITPASMAADKRAQAKKLAEEADALEADAPSEASIDDILGDEAPAANKTRAKAA